MTPIGRRRHDEGAVDELVAPAVVGQFGEVVDHERATVPQLQRLGPSVGTPPLSTQVRPTDVAFFGVVITKSSSRTPTRSYAAATCGQACSSRGVGTALLPPHARRGERHDT